MESIVEKFILQPRRSWETARRYYADAGSAHLAGREGFDPVFGARPLGASFSVKCDPLTDEILFGALENGGTVTIGADGDKLVPYEPRDMAKAEGGKSEVSF